MVRSDARQWEALLRRRQGTDPQHWVLMHEARAHRRLAEAIGAECPYTRLDARVSIQTATVRGVIVACRRRQSSQWGGGAAVDLTVAVMPQGNRLITTSTEVAQFGDAGELTPATLRQMFLLREVVLECMVVPWVSRVRLLRHPQVGASVPLPSLSQQLSLAPDTIMRLDSGLSVTNDVLSIDDWLIQPDDALEGRGSVSRLHMIPLMYESLAPDHARTTAVVLTKWFDMGGGAARILMPARLVLSMHLKRGDLVLALVRRSLGAEYGLIVYAEPIESNTALRCWRDAVRAATSLEQDAGIRIVRANEEGTRAAPEGVRLRVGQRVQNSARTKWGWGTVRAFSKSAGDPVAIVHFEDGTVRRFIRLDRLRSL